MFFNARPKIDDDSWIGNIKRFQTETERVVQKLKRSGKPLVLTVDGQAELVVQDAAAYEKLVESLTRASTLAGIQQGLVQVDQPEVSRETLEAELLRGLDIPKRKMTTADWDRLKAEVISKAKTRQSSPETKKAKSPRKSSRS